MKNNLSIRNICLIISIFITPLSFLLQVRIAHAYSIVTLDPAVAGDPGSMDSRDGSGLVIYDNGTLSFPTGIYSARGEADDINGILRVYAAATQTQEAIGTEPFFAGVTTGVSGNLIFIGAGANPVPITFYMDFEGSFSGKNVYNNLTAGLNIFIGNTSWSSGLQFIQNDPYGIETEGSGDKLTSYGSVISHSPFPQGNPNVISSDPTALHGQLVLPLMIIPGQVIELYAELSATSGAIPDENMNWSGTFDSVTDGFNTARLFFSLPAGYSLADELGGGLFSGVPVAAIPEPYTYAMFLGGLGIIGTLVGRTRRHSTSNGCKTQTIWIGPVRKLVGEAS